MSIDSTWLRCPNCFLSLSEVDDRVFGCEAGHRFDRSKHGFLTLLPPRAPRTVGDDRAMLASRDAFLRTGAYEPIAHALVELLQQARSAPDSTNGLRIADFGCGTGYYAGELAAAFDSPALLLADRSPDAVRIALRTLAGATGVVMDIWRPFPVRDRTVDAALNVFAPRNPAEFARVLSPSGIALVVVPTDRHLRELRASGTMLDVPAGKAEQVISQFAEHRLELQAQRALEYGLELDTAARAAITEMGPSAHHRSEAASDSSIAVTVSVDVLAFTLAPPAPSA